MSPRRWLLLACSVALIYATQMVSAFAMNDDLLPVQLNGAVLTVMGVGFILAAMYYLAERSERLAVARDNAHAECLAEVADLLRRLGHIEARMAVQVEGLRDRLGEPVTLLLDLSEKVDAVALAQDRRTVAIHARIDDVADSLSRQTDTVRSIESGRPTTGRPARRL